MSSDRFYVTTPIYYINDAPHLGHAYTTVVCDALARYQRMRGRSVHFLTGTDEHGQKAEKAAGERGVTPKQLADEMVQRYHAIWERMDISHDDFIRTTEERHESGARELWRRIVANGDIYKDAYEGPYCVGCESFFPESQLVDGRCPQEGHPVETLREESYFFKLSAYQQPLLDFYRENPDFVVPASRMNEVVSFVEMGLEDLSVSRTKLKWGIPVPDDEAHVMYVWIDALANYITGLGYGPDHVEGFSPFWPADLHVVGKDILRFHAVYWPAFLMSAGVPLPQRVLAHGWWLRDDRKMSKTTGNVASPNPLIDWFGTDTVRYFLLSEIPLGADGNYSEEALLTRANADLANDLGNSVSRLTRILDKNLGGRVPTGTAPGPLAAKATEVWTAYLDAMERHDVQAGLRAAWELLSATNKYLVDEAPWKLLKDPDKKSELHAVMHDGTEALRHVAAMSSPAMPATAREIWRRFGLDGDPAARPLHGEGGAEWGFPDGAGAVDHGDPLFPRIDKKKFFAEVAEAAPASGGESTPAAAEPAPESEDEGFITIDDVMKVQLRTARVLSCEKHPKADRLLVLSLDDGTGRERTICAGIASWYEPDALVGKTIVIVANLKPRKLRGVMSQGMLLASNEVVDGEERVTVVEVPGGATPGAEVR